MEKNIEMDGPTSFEDNCPKPPPFEKRDESIDRSIKGISKALNILEAVSERLDATCDTHGWDNGVVYQIQDAARNLGFALATLNRWYDDDVMGYCDERTVS